MLNILFCDDDDQFAKTQAESLQRKLELRYEITKESCRIEPLSNLERLLKISTGPDAIAWDCIFCDLGWGNLTLEGIQILNNFQLSHPRIFTVLYTAQNEDEIIGQALRWKLDFIDRIIKIDGAGYFEEMLQIIQERVDQMDAVHASSNVTLRGLRLLPRERRATFSQSAGDRLQELQSKLLELLADGGKDLAAEIAIAKGAVTITLKPDPQTQKTTLLRELSENRRRFPNLEPHALLGLDKALYIEFVVKTYGGFPQMAEKRGLDLNHIYRVNRKFKQDSFIIFRLDTIQEIVGLRDPAASHSVIQKLLVKSFQ